MTWNQSIIILALSASFCIVAESFSSGQDIQPIMASSNVENTDSNYANENSHQYQQSDDQRYLIISRTGASYYSVPGESLFGAAYGIDFAYELTGDWGLVVSGNLNSVSHGTQFVGSLGAVKLPDFYGNEWHDPFSFSFFFDQFTDSRVDTFGGSLYLNGFRLQTGYALNESLEVGAIFSAPAEEDDDVKFLFVNFPNSLPMPGIVEMSESVSGYVAGRAGDLQWAGSAGYRDDPGTFTVSGNLRRPINESMALFSNASYEANRGNWGVAFGIEFSFGGSNCSTSCCNTPCCSTKYHAADNQQTVIRAQNPDTDIQLVNVPSQSEFPDPDNNAGEFPLMPDTPTISPITNLNNRITNSWTNRYKNWSTRSLLILTPAEVERGLNADGLTNRMQDQFQSQFTKFSVQTNGGFGRTDGRRID